MGRTDAVQVTIEVVARMRALEPRLSVTYEPGWDRRGNGLAANYSYANVHHTASPSSLARPFPTQGLLRDGRTGLSGPLCNDAGPACTVEAPRLHVVAAHPANHAGASRASGPVPALSLYNPRTRGLEIDYAGTVPMLAGQLYVAHLWTRANADVLAGGNVEVVRAHAETSVTGKWDPGRAPGVTIDMRAFRAAAAALQEDDMPLTAADAALVAEAVWGRQFSAAAPGVGPAVAGRFVQHAALHATRASGFRVLRSDPAQSYNGVKGTGEMILVAPGAMVPIPSPGHYDAYKLHGISGHEVLNLAPNWFAHYRTMYEATMRQAAGAPVDLDALAGKLAALVDDKEAEVEAERLQAIADAVADELADRARE